MYFDYLIVKLQDTAQAHRKQKPSLFIFVFNRGVTDRSLDIKFYKNLAT